MPDLVRIPLAVAVAVGLLMTFWVLVGLGGGLSMALGMGLLVGVVGGWFAALAISIGHDDEADARERWLEMRREREEGDDG